MVLALCNCIPHRYLVVILCFILMLLNVGYRACFALMATQISFVNVSSNNSSDFEDNSIFPHCTTTGTSRSKQVDWSGSIVSLLNTAYFVGQFVMSIPAGALVMRFSPKRVFGLTCLLTSILLLFLPLATDVHVSVTFVIRTIQGMLEATSIPAMNAMISTWARQNQKARLINFAYAGVYLSPAVAMFAAGATACYVSWDSIMYIYGSLGVAWCVPWMLCVAANPGVLLKKLSTNDLEQQEFKQPSKPKQRIPWCKFFTSMPVIAIWVAAFCRNFIFGLMVTEVQQYFKDVYELPASMNGLLSGVPQIFMVIFMLAGAYMFDFLVKKEFLSVTYSRKVAQCSGFGIQGACALALGFVNHDILACVLLSVGAAFSGFAISGYQTNLLDLAPQYTGPLTGISRTGMLGSVICTTLVAQLTGETHSLRDWQHVFIIAGCIHLAGVVFYGIFASGNVQPWAQTATETIIPAVEYIKTAPEDTSDKSPAVKYTASPSDNSKACEIVFTDDCIPNDSVNNDDDDDNVDNSNLHNGHTNRYLPSSPPPSYMENATESNTPDFVSVHL
ncbi:hypothetical protein BsWGS_01501 [Bradybaena similaris]